MNKRKNFSAEDPAERKGPGFPTPLELNKTSSARQNDSTKIVNPPKRQSSVQDVQGVQHNFPLNG
jgi:hypothetical protein